MGFIDVVHENEVAEHESAIWYEKSSDDVFSSQVVVEINQDLDDLQIEVLNLVGFGKR